MPGRTVNPRYVPQTIVVPPNTASSAPQSSATNLGHVTLETVQVWIPSGHAGLTGIAVQLAGVHLVPFDDPAAFILGDDTQDTFEVGVEVDNGLVLLTYNTDVAFEHTFYVRWKIRDLETVATTVPATVTPITQAPSLGNVG